MSSDFAGPHERLAFVLQPSNWPAGPAGGCAPAPAAADTDPARQREVVEAFLAAARRDDLDGLLAVLDPAVVSPRAGCRCR